MIANAYNEDLIVEHCTIARTKNLWRTIDSTMYCFSQVYWKFHAVTIDRFDSLSFSRFHPIEIYRLFLWQVWRIVAFMKILISIWITLTLTLYG